MKVSILLLTLDRYETSVKAFEHNYAATKVDLSDDVELEYLVCDNGSFDKRVIQYFAPVAKYHRVNSKNEGCAKSFNQLFLRATGAVIVFYGCDNFMPDGWLTASLSELNSMKVPGIIGISDGAVDARGPGWITGAFVIPRATIDTCGFFYDEFDVYGCEDLDFNERVLHFGLECRMVPNLKGSHLAHQPEDNKSYREMKYKSFIRNSVLLNERQAEMRSGNIKKAEIPPLRDPL